MASADLTTLNEILDQYDDSSYFQLDRMLIQYLDRTYDLLLEGKKFIIRQLNELESFLLANFSEDDLIESFEFTPYFSGLTEDDLPKTNILFKLFSNLQRLHLKLTQRYYDGEHALFQKFPITKSTIIKTNIGSIVFPQIKGKEYINQLYEGVDCRRLYNKYLIDLSNNANAKYLIKEMMHEFDEFIIPKIFLMTQEERGDYHSFYSRKIHQKPPASSYPYTYEFEFPSDRDGMILKRKPFDQMESVKERMTRLGIDEDHLEEPTKLSKKDLDNAPPEILKLEKFIKELKELQKQYESQLKLSFSKIPTFNQDKMDQSRAIIEEYLPLFHDIYLNHYANPFPFTNPFIINIIPTESPISGRVSLHNNLIALYLYLAYKKHGVLDKVKEEASGNWRKALAKEMVDGIKGDNYTRLKNVYNALTRLYKPDRAEPKIRTYTDYLKKEGLFGLVKKGYKKTGGDTRKFLGETLSKLREVSKNQSILDIEELLDEWEKDIDGVSSENKQKWRENIFDDMD